jgi:hypothetical protein
MGRGAAQRKAALQCRTRMEGLSESEGWRALEEDGKRRSLGCAANVSIGQRREQAERRDESNEEKRQNRGQIRAAGIAVRNQQAHQRYSNCNCRNQDPSTPLPVLHHRRSSLASKYIES